MNSNLVLLLCVAFQAKHFIADFPLQTQYMLGKSKDEGWELPLLAHVAAHAAGTLLITVWFGVWQALLLSIGDAAIHFVMDRIKAQKNLLGRWIPSEPNFWNALGFDQMIHHLTSFAIVWWICSHSH